MKQSTPIYVLGLERNFRGRALVQQLKDNFEDVQVFFGFDAYASTQSELLENLDLELIQFLMHRKISLGEAGCAISHKLLYDDINLRKISHTIILEDDCVIVSFPKFISVINEFNKVLISNPISPMALQLGSLHFDYSQNEEELLLAKTPFPAYGTFAYLLNQPAATMLAKRGTKISSTADWPIWALEIQWYRSTQQVIQVQTDSSTILHDRTDIFSTEDRKQLFHYIRKCIRYLSTILGIRILIANRNKISTKLILKWDVKYKIWRRKEEKKIRKSNR